MESRDKSPFVGVSELITAAVSERATMYGRGRDEKVRSFLNELYSRTARDLAIIDDELFENILGIAAQNDQNGNGVFAKFEEMVLSSVKTRHPDAKLAQASYGKRWQVVYMEGGNKKQVSIRRALDGK